MNEKLTTEKFIQKAISIHGSNLVFWNNDLSDFIDWLYSNKHILNNI